HAHASGAPAETGGNRRMSWLQLDDHILEHPKFLRVVRDPDGGSEAVHLWLGLRAYCGQQLTDGFVPDDMLDEVRGPRDPKRRKRALDALKKVGLLDPADGGVVLHNFLRWSASREEVIDRREKARDRKRKSRGGHSVTDAVTDGVSQRDDAGTDGE